MGLVRKFRIATAVLPALALAACAYAPLADDMDPALATYDDLISSVDRNTDLQNALRQNIARVMVPGETVANWSRTGVDLDDELQAAPGGSSANVIMAKPDGRTVYSADHAFTASFGGDFTTYISSGPAALFADNPESVDYTLLYIADGVWLETAEKVTKIDNASCSSNGSDAVRIHAKRPFSSLGGMEQRYLASYLAASRYNNGTICSVGEAAGSNSWRSRYFLPDGKRLPVFDREGTKDLRIVPLTEVDRMIATG